MNRTELKQGLMQISLALMGLEDEAASLGLDEVVSNIDEAITLLMSSCLVIINQERNSEVQEDGNG